MSSPPQEPVPSTANAEVPPLAVATLRLALFLLTMLAVAGAVFCVGWFTPFREVMHGALISVAVFALLPFAIIAFGLFLGLVAVGLMLMFSLITALSGGGTAMAGGEGTVGEPFVRIGMRMTPGYYRWLASRRHPVFWGVPCGLLLGGLTLWLVLSTLVLPGEAQTVAALAEARERIESYYSEHKRYPRPSESGHLPYQSFGEERAGVMIDGFGRPLEYQVAGRWRIASYRVKALGYDGRPGGTDDLCISGATTLARWSVTLTRNEKGMVNGIKAKLGAIRELRCEGD